MMNLMLLDEGEEGIIVLWTIFMISIILFGLLVPITAMITYLIYHFRLHYKFAWAKDFIEQEQSKTKA